MDELIDDVRKFILEGRRVEEPEAVDLGDSARQAWETVDTLDAELVVETSATVRADPARLQRVFENLFRNAIEHGRSDVTITVRSGPDRFSVADDGPGIPADDRETVFERGYTSSEDGTGFGLAIVENIAAAHDWTVAVEESEAGGASFVFSGVIFESGKIGKTLH
jgi:signal transduction histidine kinase